MFKQMHNKKALQMVLGLGAGIIFGFLLQKGGVTTYEVIIGQLLLTDFTVLKIMLSALKALKLEELHPKPGSWNTSMWGGLLFGVGFATLGYCPGTVAGAVGQGSMDALLGGVVGIIAGAGIFASLYPRIKGFLGKGSFVPMTFPQRFKVNEWAIIIPLVGVIVVLLYVMEMAGL
jgi:hypothetical protein